jgi:hypothetical protein
VDRSKLTEKEIWNGTVRDLKPYQMGLQVPRGVDSRISEESALRAQSEGVITAGKAGGYS